MGRASCSHYLPLCSPTEACAHNPCRRDFAGPGAVGGSRQPKRFGMAFKEKARAPASSPMIASGYTYGR